MLVETITRAKGGDDECVVQLADVTVPDLWHVVMYLDATGALLAKAEILDCWHLAHDLLRTLREGE